MNQTLDALEAALDAAGAPGPLGPGDAPTLLAWAKRLVGASGGLVRLGDLELQQPEAHFTQVPAAPWPGVRVSQAAVALFAAHTAGGPLVFDRFPPSAAGATFISGVPGPLEDLLSRGGLGRVQLTSPGTHMAVPLAGYDRYSGILLDGHHNFYGDDSCRVLARLAELAHAHGGPWPTPEEVLCEEGGRERTPMLQFQGRSVELRQPVTVGQDDACTISVTDNLTSRRHLMVVHRADGEVMVIDLKSSNGTFVNGDRVEDRVLRDGDVIHTAKRHWSLAFHRVDTIIREEARKKPNQAGCDLRRGAGARVAEVVAGWTGEQGDRLAASLALELVALQLGLRELALVWWDHGKLRFTGATTAPRPGRLEQWSEGARKLLRLVEEVRPVPVAEGFGGVVPLAPSGAIRAIFTHAEGVAVHLDHVGEAVRGLLDEAGRPRLPLEDEARRQAKEAAAKSSTSGVACARALRAYATAGYPAEARVLAAELAARFLDGDELEAVLEELKVFEG